MSHKVKTTLFTVSLVGLLTYHLLPSWFFVEYFVLTDFRNFYSSASLFQAGKGMYPDFAETGEPQVSLNPPAWTVILCPLASLPYKPAFWIFTAASIFAGLASVYIVNKILFNGRSASLWILTLLLMAYPPTHHTLLQGNVPLLLLLAYTLAWAYARNRNDRAAGIILGLATAIKFFPGLFLLPFLAMRRWKFAAWQIATFGAVHLVGLVVAGPQNHWDYLVTMRAVDWSTSMNNGSVFGYFQRLFVKTGSHPIIELPWLAYGLIGIIALVSLGLLFLAAARNSQGLDEKQHFDLVFSLATVLSIFLSPLGWTYYNLLLLIPFLALWQVGSLRCRAIAVAVFLVSAIPPLHVQIDQIQPIHMFVHSGIYFYLLGALAALLGWVIMKYHPGSRLVG